MLRCFGRAILLLVQGKSGSFAQGGAAVAGASFPPITVCMRTYFRQRLGDDALLAAAYSLESVLIELIFIAGPMLVAMFVAFASPAVAVWFAAACGGLGAALFRRTPALRAWRIEKRSGASLLGPLMGAGLAALALPWGAWMFAGWSLFAGVVMAPALIQSMLVVKTARSEHSSEAFTWSASALLGGIGLGASLALRPR